MFINPDIKNDKWVEENKASFALFDEFGVGVAVISADMKVIALNVVMKKWFPDIDVDKKPTCYKAFINPPRDEICSWCSTIKALKDGKVHECVSKTSSGGVIRSYRKVSAPIKAKDGRIIASLEIVEDITDRIHAAEQLDKFNKCFLDFGPDPVKNINLLTALCGELLGATCALYNHIEDGTLCSVGQWQTPQGYIPSDKAEGYICFDVIQQAKDDILIARNLQESKYAKTDPNVARYNLKTYMGKAVKTKRGFIGSLCVVYQDDVEPAENDKKMIGIIASAIAIEEERRAAEDALRASEELYHATIDGINYPVYLVDEKLNIVFINSVFSRWCEELGLRTDVVGMNLFDAMPFLTDNVRREYEEVLRTGKPLASEGKTILGGKEIITEAQRIPILEGGKVKKIIAMVHDVTLRKRLEMNLKESEEKYRKLFENANDAIFIADAKTGQILDVNRQAERLMGLPKKELIGMDQSRLHPPEEAESYKEKFLDQVKMAMDDRNAQAPSLEGEVINAEGERIQVYINASILEIGGKTVIQGIFRDISELKRIERDKKEAESLALIDPHTQLYNYRYLQRRIHSEFELAKRRATPLSLMMVDIDYFKSVNDTFGHEYGDAVLQEFAIVLQHASRGIDIVTRFEGEGFAIILPDTEERGALAFAERIQRIIKKHRFGANRVKLRISIGICSYPEYNITTVDDLLSDVDKCVRLAKDQGGDTIAVYSQLRKKKPSPVPLDISSQKRVTTITRKFIDLIQRNKQNTIEAVYALAHTVGAKNAYTEEHSEEMVKLSTELGKKLELTDQELEDIKHGAMLHDIGKLGISEKILLKRGKLTKKEFEIIKKHPQIGADIIRPVHFLKNVVPIILYHHERYDGYGYGAKLKGEEIPLGARIVAIVDVYQALVSNRPYRKAYPKREAIKIIKEESGTHFDPKVVKAFLEVITKRKKKRTGMYTPGRSAR